MRLPSPRLGKTQPSFFLLFLFLIIVVARVSAEPAGDATDTAAETAQTTDDPSTSDNPPSVTETTASTTESTSLSASTSESTTSTSESSVSTTSMDSTTTTSSETSSTTDNTSTTSSVSTTTTSTSSSTTSTAAAIVTIPPTAGAPYMQTSNTPEGTVFIAVGAILGLIGLAVLAWRGMVAWSVNRSVRRAAMAQASESKRLLRGSRKKRSTAVYSAAPMADVSLDKLGAATRASYKPARRVPSSNSGLFYSPTAGGPAGSHASLNAAAGNRGSTYLPAGYYAAAGSSTPVRDAGPHGGLSSPPGYPPSSPSLPPTGAYYDGPHNARPSYVGNSTSSLNLSQAPQGRAPSAYLEDLFENHAPPRNPDSGRRERR
ncbi:uncharacterized protein N7459_006862 [Penicillium hispanicum]|uniref:uncharacterized protein n=1 Tax=Penicillium hispanicum TaxID=1080232 RepID=UPI002540AAE7|nr:uncharacterized protein N7459_006862 [Penicillium hispanicum]KAJ5577898.1 hypothetical protein N7459_006862 [Penicillium hispanicum]